MKVGILGAGRWGSTLAWVQARAGREVILWNRRDKFLKELLNNRQNKYFKLPGNVKITGELKEALSGEVVFISIRAQHFKDLCLKLKREVFPGNKLFILAMKGLEEKSGRRLSEIFNKNFPGNPLAFLAGPGHPQELSKNIPTAMTVAVQKPADLAKAVRYCQTGLIKIFPSSDFIGVETGAALKNIMGLAGGIMAGLNKPSFKSYLLTRGPLEVGRLIKALGGRPQTAFGLSHLGDYGATVFSGFSHNHKAGELWVKKRKLSTEAEGVPTVKAVNLLIKKHKLDLPICSAVYKILYQKAKPEFLIKSLMDRRQERDLK
ncbi:MAG TPA: NAD(P)-binding domain-containing protein [Patescibacteria group bacterium]|nr:NAD(P)-binding domain-containing protein [Patescibacteria group bacterium]